MFLNGNLVRECSQHHARGREKRATYVKGPQNSGWRERCQPSNSLTPHQRRPTPWPPPRHLQVPPPTQFYGVPGLRDRRRTDGAAVPMTGQRRNCALCTHKAQPVRPAAPSTLTTSKRPRRSQLLSGDAASPPQSSPKPLSRNLRRRASSTIARPTWLNQPHHEHDHRASTLLAISSLRVLLRARSLPSPPCASPCDVARLP